MTNTPLGVFALIGATFRTYTNNIMPLFLIAFVPTIILGFMENYFMADMMRAALENPNDPGAIFGVGYWVFMLFSFVISIVIIAVTHLAAADATAGNAMNVSGYINTSLRVFIPMVILLIAAYFAVIIGFMLLIIPGLILMGMWAVIIPVLVVEQGGFGSLGRSARLTKNYRWPIIGAALLFILILLAIMIVLGMVTGFAVFDADPAALINGLPIWVTILNTIASSIMYGLSAVFAILLYTRLLEIKEGASSETAEVFA